jgi:hypothetical protein
VLRDPVADFEKEDSCIAEWPKKMQTTKSLKIRMDNPIGLFILKILSMGGFVAPPY